MRYLLVAVLIAIATPASAAPGDAALQALFDGMAPELAQTACIAGDPVACSYAELSRHDLAQGTALMVEVIRDAQTHCVSDPNSLECGMLNEIDREADEVLKTNGTHKT